MIGGISIEGTDGEGGGQLANGWGRGGGADW